MNPGELTLITSGTSNTYNLKTLKDSNIIVYQFVLEPAHYWFDNPLIREIDAWCEANVGQKYATWARNMNCWVFFKKEHWLACRLVWEE